MDIEKTDMNSTYWPFLSLEVVYIDTEGTFRPERIRQIAEAKGVSPSDAMENIVYARSVGRDRDRVKKSGDGLFFFYGI